MTIAEVCPICHNPKNFGYDIKQFIMAGNKLMKNFLFKKELYPVLNKYPVI